MKASDIRRGTVLMYENNPCRVMEFQHRTPGNLRAFVQVRMRNLNTGNTFETRFSSTELVNEVRLDTKELQVLYRDANGYHVMDASTYDQYTLDEETPLTSVDVHIQIPGYSPDLPPTPGSVNYSA